MILRIPGIRPCSAAHQGGAVGTAKYPTSPMSKTAQIMVAARGNRRGCRHRIQAAATCGSRNHAQCTYTSAWSRTVVVPGRASARWSTIVGARRNTARSKRIG